jgi:hypothetical protein
MSPPLPKITWTGGAGGTWLAQDPAQDDTGDVAAYERAAAWSFTGRAKGVNFATRYTREVKLGFLPEWMTWKAKEGAHVGAAIERLFDDGWARFTYFPDAADPTTFGVYMLDEKTRKTMQRARLSAGNPIYAITLGMQRIV